jgi:DNA-binding LytR/AlgR family response regulator
MAARPPVNPAPGAGANNNALSCWCLRGPATTDSELTCLVVDDEPLARDGLAAMLRERACVARVATAPNGVEALRLLGQADFDVAYVSSRLPGLDGRELAAVIGRLRNAPAVILVVGRSRSDAGRFDPGTVAHLRRPVIPDRLTLSLRWAAALRTLGHPHCGPVRDGAAVAAAGAPARPDDPLIPVEVGRTTRLVPLSSVRWAEACHDYVRLYTVDGCYLIRARMTALADTWQQYGDLVRIHRSYVVGVRFVSQLKKVGPGQFAVVVDGRELPVSRRYLPKIRHRLPAPA